MIAGTAEFLRAVPKRFATVQAILPDRHDYPAADGGTDVKTWTIEPDAEIKCFGWWGRPGAFPRSGIESGSGSKLIEGKQPLAISMMCDEPTEEDMHGGVVRLPPLESWTIVLHPLKGPIDRSIGCAEIFQGSKSVLPQS